MIAPLRARQTQIQPHETGDAQPVSMEQRAGSLPLLGIPQACLHYLKSKAGREGRLLIPNWDLRLSSQLSIFCPKSCLLPGWLTVGTFTHFKETPIFSSWPSPTEAQTSTYIAYTQRNCIIELLVYVENRRLNSYLKLLKVVPYASADRPCECLLYIRVTKYPSVFSPQNKGMVCLKDKLMPLLFFFWEKIFCKF